MACNCKDITPQSKECYEQMITIEIPEHMSKYRDNRVKVGLSSKISIDPCIFVEIWQLWQKGIITYGSCCGHNGKNPSFVNVDDSNIQQMLDMGYLPNHYDLQRMDTFALKSVGGHYDDAGESNCTIFDVSGSAIDVLKQIAECPITVDSATVPKAGIEAAPEQVVINMSVNYTKYKKLLEVVKHYR